MAYGRLAVHASRAVVRCHKLNILSREITRCESCPARPSPEKAWFRLVIALLCAASFVVSAALLDEEVTSVRRAPG